MIRILLYSELDGNERLDYVIQNINFHPFFENQIILERTNQIDKYDIYYGQNLMKSEASLKIPFRAIFLQNMVVSGDLPAYVSSNMNFDIFDFLFYHWSRFEEYNWPDNQRNTIGLMPEEETWAIKNKLNFKPFVDDVLEMLAVALFPNWKKPNSPKQIISADLDYLSYNELNLGMRIKTLGSAIKRSKNLLMTLPKLKLFINDKTILQNWLSMIKPDIVFLLVGGEHEFDFPKKGQFHKNLDRTIEIARQLNIKIGLHPSFGSAISKGMMLYQKTFLESKLGQKIEDVRMHYLNYDYVHTTSILEQLQISREYSCGYNEHVGYKAGTAYSFNYYNWNEDRISSVKCFPMAWMDSAQWAQSQKEISKYKTDTTSFENANQSTIRNYHPHFQFYLSCLL